MSVTIDHIGGRGDGIAKGPIYVPYSVTGDVLELKLNGKRGRIKKIITPSPHRIEPICDHFGECGGCLLQHVEYQHYALWKAGLVRTALEHRGFEKPEILAPLISPPASRRRARLHAKDGVLGFSERGSHRIIDIQKCPVMVPEIVAMLDPLRGFLKGRDNMTVHITCADNGLDVVLEGKGEPDLDLRMDIAAFAESNDLARISWLDTSLKKTLFEMLAERRKPLVKFGNRDITPPPGSFLQATQEGQQALIAHVKRDTAQSTRVVDLFSGCGTFSVALEDDCMVHAVENDDMMLNRQKGSARLTTEVRDLFKRPLLPHELKKYDTAIIDPPRMGAQDQVKEIAQCDALERVIMISCNPISFARDVRILVDSGFQMGPVQPVDQFLFTPHLEMICTLIRA